MDHILRMNVPTAIDSVGTKVSSNTTILFLSLGGSNFFVHGHFRHFSIGELLGDISWEKIRALTETDSDSTMAISIKGKANIHNNGKSKQSLNIKIEILKIYISIAQVCLFSETSDISHSKQGTRYPVSIQGKFKYLR